MSQFSRRARWLNILFPTSVAPRSQDPSSVSDDVSLTQPYDGGGWAIADADWFYFLTTAAAAAGNSVLFTTLSDQIFRWMSADLALLGGAGPEARFNLTPSDGGGEITATPEIVVIGTTPRHIEVFTPIVGPAMNIVLNWDSGSVGTILIGRIYGALAPLGSVFHV